MKAQSILSVAGFDEVALQRRGIAMEEGVSIVKILFILNDPPYGTERCYNALRLAHALSKSDAEAEVTVFLMADSVIAARKGQKTPEGYYNMEHMLKRVIASTGKVLLCGLCMDARGMTEEDMLDGVRRSTMAELAEATTMADKVLTF